MMLLAISAAFVGFVHSLAPGHWLPVVLMSRGKKWPLKMRFLGATVASSGHILVSSTLGVASVLVGSHFLAGVEEEIERYSSLLLVFFGLGYALIAYFRHSECVGHTHHGRNPRGQKAPYLFLFSLGLSPCVAVIPVFITAGSRGFSATILSITFFSIGVLSALVGATLLVSKGLLKLDHPIFEHYGDVITGLGILVTGTILFFW